MSLSLSGRRSSRRRQLSGSPSWWFISRLRRSHSRSHRSLLINQDALLFLWCSHSRMSVSGWRLAIWQRLCPHLSWHPCLQENPVRAARTKTLEYLDIPVADNDYLRVIGACCENVIRSSCSVLVLLLPWGLTASYCLFLLFRVSLIRIAIYKFLFVKHFKMPQPSKHN